MDIFPARNTGLPCGYFVVQFQSPCSAKSNVRHPILTNSDSDLHKLNMIETGAEFQGSLSLAYNTAHLLEGGLRI